jgi:hypothetical protein
MFDFRTITFPHAAKDREGRVCILLGTDGTNIFGYAIDQEFGNCVRQWNRTGAGNFGSFDLVPPERPIPDVGDRNNRIETLFIQHNARTLAGFAVDGLVLADAIIRMSPTCDPEVQRIQDFARTMVNEFTLEDLDRP